MIGRLPNRSDKTPSQGEQKNCISAKTTANRALHFAASVIWPPRKSRISLGSTGMIKPIARMSSVTVTRINMTAAGRDFMRVEHERNVVAAVVSTAEQGLAQAPLHLSCRQIMRRLSYVSPKTEMRESKIHELGLFAIADIAKDESVPVKGGHIADGKTLRQQITPRLGTSK